VLSSVAMDLMEEDTSSVAKEALRNKG
jgi:hypothetical protein